ncbi:hypothetical protein [Amycolatopsis sp. NPDC052450]|uniref:hypothetical protein n=1 Tax=Amycolatopsis sp. NPDC052450 TaxID=3363937 RepID=UPI0037C5E6A6
MTRRREDPAQSSHWRALSVGGLPAAEQVGNPPVFEYFQFDEKSQYWGDDRCGAALKAAEFVIGNLRSR